MVDDTNDGLIMAMVVDEGSWYWLKVRTQDHRDPLPRRFDMAGSAKDGTKVVCVVSNFSAATVFR